MKAAYFTAVDSKCEGSAVEGNLVLVVVNAFSFHMFWIAIDLCISLIKSK